MKDILFKNIDTPLRYKWKIMSYTPGILNPYYISYTVDGALR